MRERTKVTYRVLAVLAHLPSQCLALTPHTSRIGPSPSTGTPCIMDSDTAEREKY